jgi:hemoglobin-like flavoprotein
MDSQTMQPQEKEKKNSADKQRTAQQNKALHLYLTQVAQELDRQGHTMQNVVKKITKVEIKPTLYNVKEMIWREIQKAVLGKDSTTFLEKNEIDQVYDVMNKWLGTYFEIYIPFPNDEQRQWENAYYSEYKKD